MKLETFHQRPLAMSDFMQNVALVSSRIKAGQKQIELAKQLGVSTGAVSNYMKVATRWPSTAITIIRSNPDSFSGKTLSSMANKSFSDLRGGEPRRRSRKPSLVATLQAIIQGRKPRTAMGRKRDPERLLSQERMVNQELRQRIRDLEAEFAQENSKTLAQRNASISESPDILYLCTLLSSRISARVEIDAGQGKIVIHSGRGEIMSGVLEKLISP